MTLEAEEILGAEIEKIAQMQKIKTTLSPKMIISEEDSVASSEQGEAPVLPDEEPGALPDIRASPGMKKTATVIMREVLGESPAIRSSNSNPQLLSPKVENIDGEESQRSGETPRTKSKIRVGSARSPRNNFIEKVEKIKPYIAPQLIEAKKAQKSSKWAGMGG